MRARPISTGGTDIQRIPPIGRLFAHVDLQRPSLIIPEQTLPPKRSQASPIDTGLLAEIQGLLAAPTRDPCTASSRFKPGKPAPFCFHHAGRPLARTWPPSGSTVEHLIPPAYSPCLFPAVFLSAYPPVMCTLCEPRAAARHYFSIPRTLFKTARAVP